MWSPTDNGTVGCCEGSCCCTSCDFNTAGVVGGGDGSCGAGVVFLKAFNWRQN